MVRVRARVRVRVRVRVPRARVRPRARYLQHDLDAVREALEDGLDVDALRLLQWWGGGGEV